jgi:transposase
VLLVEEGQTLASMARLFQTAPHRVPVWQRRFAVEGRDGLLDQTRRGRPPKLRADDRAFLVSALAQGPQAYGLPVTVWSIRDLQALLDRERGSRSASILCAAWCRRSASAPAARAMTCSTARMPRRWRRLAERFEQFFLPAYPPTPPD